MAKRMRNSRRKITKKERNAIQYLEHVWKLDKYSNWFIENRTINDLTGFISPDGSVIPIPDMTHSAYMNQFENETGLSEIAYFKNYGAIRCRPGRVFVILDIPRDSLNVEVHVKPTTEQIRTLQTITSKVFYDFWGDDISSCPKDGVSPMQFIKDLYRYWKL